MPYGADGFCNSSLGEDFLIVAAGSGGASSCAFGTPAISGVAGGTSSGYPKPSYQYLAAGIPNDGVRDIPDIMMFASNGFWGPIACFATMRALRTAPPANRKTGLAPVVLLSVLRSWAVFRR
jgi:hypothetical protein